jgi:hypothetical protein
MFRVAYTVKTSPIEVSQIRGVIFPIRESGLLSVRIPQACSWEVPRPFELWLFPEGNAEKAKMVFENTPDKRLALS